MSQHIIHTQKVILELARPEEALDYQDRVSRLLGNGLGKAIEQVLDNIAAEGEVVRIDSIALDLGEIEKQNFEKEFQAKLVSNLKDAVNAAKGSAVAETGVRVIKAPVSLFEAFIYFLRYGGLPWHSHAKSMAAWQKELIEQWAQAQWNDAADWIKKNYTGNPAILERLTHQFADAFLLRLADTIVLLSGGDGYFAPRSTAAVISDTIMMVRSILQVSPHGDVMTPQQIWLQVLTTLCGIQQGTGSKSIIATIAKVLLQSAINKNAGTVAMYKNSVLQQQADTALKEIMLLLIDEAGNEQRAKTQDDITLQERFEATNHDENLWADTLPDSFKTTGEKAATTNRREEYLQAPIKPSNGKQNSDKNDVTYVTNSGLVLLHPFLGAYFSDLGLIENKRFVDTAAQQRAVLLIYYLATGEMIAAEFNLVLQKVLCGYPAEDTLPAVIKLTDKEEYESTQLLRTVIDYWPPLKNTSVDGFRGTFMQREGKLSQIDSGWLLRVEQKTVDILLGKLPWGFSTIRMPWMEKMMNVEWA